MNILITGGFGNTGALVIDECLKRGHAVTVFEVSNARTERKARTYCRRGVKVRYGDIRKPDDIREAVIGQDAVIHMAAILPPVSETNEAFCVAVNAGGTKNVIEAIRALEKKPSLVYVSSASVMGPTQDSEPPIRPGDMRNPTDNYSRSKVAAEIAVEGSGICFCILRLAAVMPTKFAIGAMLGMVKLIFDMPLEARCEIVFDEDVASALVSATEDLAGAGLMGSRVGFIAGGEGQGCRLRVRSMIRGIFDTLGLGIPDDRLFPVDLNSYYLDWCETEEIQSILRYQNHSFRQWQVSFRRNNGLLRALVRVANPLILRWLEKQSPRY